MGWRSALAVVVAAGGAGVLAAPCAAPLLGATSMLLLVDSRLPSWRAPGAFVLVEGFAGASEPLRLETGGVVVAITTSGPLGRFRFRFRAPELGRYPLTIAGQNRAKMIGTLIVRPLHLAAVGDITFGEQVGPAISRYGGAYPWAGVAKTLRGADLTVGNLETSVSTRGVAAAKKYTFRGPPNALPAMASRAGFDVLTLANNHSLDYGRDALLDTLRYVRAAGIQPVGAGGNNARARRAAVVEAGGIKLAFLGYSDINPAGFSATASTAGTAAAETTAITADVHAARRSADIVACFFHWGTELRRRPDSRQQQFAAACLNAGAQIVLGAHPHVLGGVTRPSRRTLIAWTLGNFVFPSSGETADTAILQIEIDADGVRGHRLVPVRIDGFRPQRAFASKTRR